MAQVTQQWFPMRDGMRSLGAARIQRSVRDLAARARAGRATHVNSRERHRATPIALVALVLVGWALLLSGTAQAQGSGNGFLFGQPQGSFTIRGGFDRASAGGDLFGFVTDQLTLRRGDFSGPTVGGDLAFRVAPRFDVVLSGSYATANASSEFRRLVGNDNMPIAQTTSFRRVPVIASVRAYLTPRGRSVGNFAWVPARFAPYVGAGGGAAWYSFRQAGDFVDPGSNVVFSDVLTSSGWAPAAQGMLGLDYSITPRIALTGEGKYTWSRAAVGQGFTGFNRIDLSGISTTLGISVRY